MPNYKLIFEAPNLPGGIIFTQVVAPPHDGARAKAEKSADQFGLRFKGAEQTTEPVSPLRFAPERFDLAHLVKTVTETRTIEGSELSMVRQVVEDAIIAADRARMPGQSPAPIIPDALATRLNIVQCQMHTQLTDKFSGAIALRLMTESWARELREIELRLRSIPVVKDPAPTGSIQDAQAKLDGALVRFRTSGVMASDVVEAISDLIRTYIDNA